MKTHALPYSKYYKKYCSFVENFILMKSAKAIAYKNIEQRQNLKLSKEDSEAFIEAILYPSQPSDALRKAISRYKQLIKNNDMKN
jgi:uncharacterized protein (DUF1778 family)